MSGSLAIVGFSNTDKYPGPTTETVYGAGGLGSASLPLVGACVGLKTSSGSLTNDAAGAYCTSYDDCDAAAGAGSELARMGYRFIDWGLPVWLFAVAPAASSPVAAAATITFAFASGTAPLTVGEYSCRIAGKTYSIGISTSDTVTTMAAALKNKINADVRAIVTANNSSGVLTITHKNTTIRGNTLLVYGVTTGLPSNVTATLGGGGTATNTTGITLASGAGTEDATNIIAVLNSGYYNRVAIAQQDATNAALWETYVDTKAGPLVNKCEHFHIGFNGALATATSLAQTTLNNARFCALWMLNCESPPAEIAAAMAAASIAYETTGDGGINANYDGLVLRSIAPSQFAADNPTRANAQSALDNSVTPCETRDGKAVVISAITTKSLLGSTPDYRTLYLPNARVPDWVRADLALQWSTVFGVANPYVRDDAAAEEPEPPAGVATPVRWNSFVTKRMIEHQDNLIVTGVTTTAGTPQSEFNSTANRIDSAVPVIPLPHQHAIGISVRQFNVSDIASS